MTWLPIETSAASERDAVLGRHPDVYALHRRYLDVCSEVVDPDLLTLARARMAQLLHCREELARHDSDRLGRLDNWYSSDSYGGSSFSDLERAVLAFVEQFILDPSLITDEMAAGLEHELGTSGVVNFTTAVASYEASLRLSTLLDLEPADLEAAK